VVLVVGLSALTYRFVETPCREAFRRLVSHSSRHGVAT
jgi:peptidoglycan/LPS O-acetylase OafA/YrhL